MKAMLHDVWDKALEIIVSIFGVAYMLIYCLLPIAILISLVNYGVNFNDKDDSSHVKHNIEQKYKQTSLDKNYRNDIGNDRNTGFSEDEYEKTGEDAFEEDDFEAIEKYRGTREGDNYVFITPTGKYYHTINCPSLSRTKYVKPFVLGQTPDGYEECSKCRPYQFE